MQPGGGAGRSVRGLTAYKNGSAPCVTPVKVIGPHRKPPGDSGIRLQASGVCVCVRAEYFMSVHEARPPRHPGRTPPHLVAPQEMQCVTFSPDLPFSLRPPRPFASYHPDNNPHTFTY